MGPQIINLSRFTRSRLPAPGPDMCGWMAAGRVRYNRVMTTAATGATITTDVTIAAMTATDTEAAKTYPAVRTEAVPRLRRPLIR